MNDEVIEIDSGGENNKVIALEKSSESENRSSSMIKGSSNAISNKVRNLPMMLVI